ncbi:DNA (cytosine-5)-methyltransferase 1 [Pedococcus cremeus]|uniref:Cytosine-specific methyltransferase n=1 Tax=Pedococcus cremeus TaxID=587636 RepID=A0A1H9QLE9_9MICO|nr:DNA (cytosine-5-)-methyltransferase [Pedococcus cremeus]SER61240.1 DNA (cytosine-5)-methyltransferase 1 [Pedococcus cremeus]
MGSTSSGFTFSDLFAGVGGFHAALHAAGGQWVFASEIDRDAAGVYDYNWLRPLRKMGAAPPAGVSKFRVSGDIVPLTEPKVQVPHADVLAAGFPCQPFSKSGKQLGMEETRGTLFWNIAQILQDEERRPSVVLLENVRNLAGPRHTETLATIVRTLRQLGYRTASKPAVLSPHLLPPELGGRPQARERVFILAHHVGRETAEDAANYDDPIVTTRTSFGDWNKKKWSLEEHLPLEKAADSRYELESTERKWIDTWNSLLTDVAMRLDPGERLPGFPIWADAFRTVQAAADIIEAAELRGEPLPAWKADFLIKNARFYERHAEVIDRYQMTIDSFPASRRKFEWQAGPHVALEESILHFRPSGIRAKRPDYVPALVAITQTSVLGTRRRLTPRETARLQGLPDWFEFRQSDEEHTNGWVQQKDAASYKQMGNGVNVGVVFFLFCRYVLEHSEEIPQHIVDAVRTASEDGRRGPDSVLTQLSRDR